MEIYVNYGAVALAAVANMALGFLWYGPLFGKQWMALSGITRAGIDAQKAKGGMWKSYVLALIGSLLMAFVLWHAILFSGAYLNVKGAYAGLMGGFWNWLGFVAPVTVSMVLWEGKPWKLWILTNGYYLVSLLVMGIILARWI